MIVITCQSEVFVLKRFLLNTITGKCLDVIDLGHITPLLQLHIQIQSQLPLFPLTIVDLLKKYVAEL